jgi:hypothetical protein
MDKKLLDKNEDVKMGLLKYLEEHQYDDTVLSFLTACTLVQEKRIDELEERFWKATT